MCFPFGSFLKQIGYKYNECKGFLITSFLRLATLKLCFEILNFFWSFEIFLKFCNFLKFFWSFEILNFQSKKSETCDKKNLYTHYIYNQFVLKTSTWKTNFLGFFKNWNSAKYTVKFHKFITNIRNFRVNFQNRKMKNLIFESFQQFLNHFWKCRRRLLRAEISGGPF